LDGQISKLGLHSIYLTLLTEWGIVGFFCFAMVFYRLYVFSKPFSFERDFILGFLAVSLVNGIGNDLIGEVHFWVFLGLSIQMLRLRYEELGLR
jgi:hypothetical protein